MSCVIPMRMKDMASSGQAVILQRSFNRWGYILYLFYSTVQDVLYSCNVYGDVLYSCNVYGNAF